MYKLGLVTESARGCLVLWRSSILKSCTLLTTALPGKKYGIENLIIIIIIIHYLYRVIQSATIS